MFFQTINQMMAPGVDFNLSIRKCDGRLVVAALPKSNGLKDQAKDHITPFTVSGTPEELDAGFLEAVERPVQKTTGLLMNMKQFEEQADRAAAGSRAVKEQQQKESKEAKEKKESYDKNFKRGEELEKQENYSDAIISFRSARLYATEESAKVIDEKIRILQARLSQGSLFEVPATTAATASAERETSTALLRPEPVFDITHDSSAPIQPDPSIDYEEDPDEDDNDNELF